MASGSPEHEREAGSISDATNVDLTRDDTDSAAPVPTALWARIGERLAASAAVIEGDIYVAVMSELPAYADLARDPGEAEELRASIGRVVEMFVGLVRDPDMLSDKTLDLIRGAGIEIGRRRAAQGMPLGDVQRLGHIALRTGLRRLRSEVRQVGITEATFDAIAGISEVLHEYVRAFNEGVATGFIDIGQHHAAARAEERSELLGQILDGTGETEDATKACPELRVDRLAPSTLLVVAPSGTSGSRSLAGPVSALLRAVDGSIRGPMRSSPTVHTPVLVPQDCDVSVSALLHRVRNRAAFSNVVIAVEHVLHVTDLTPTYTWLTDLLAVPGNRRGPAVVEIEDLVPGWLVDATPAGYDVRFLNWSLGPVLRTGEETSELLLEAVRAYLDAQGVNRRAAELLGVDPRTASKRRQEFEELTGFSLASANHRRILDFALLLVDLRRDALPAPGATVWSPARSTRRR